MPSSGSRSPNFPDQPGRGLGEAGPDEVGRTIDGDDIRLAHIHEAEDAMADLPVAHIRADLNDFADGAGADKGGGHRIRIRRVS